MEQHYKPYFTMKELANEHGVSTKTVWAWIHRGLSGGKKLKSYRVGSLHRIKPEDWQAFSDDCNNK